MNIGKGDYQLYDRIFKSDMTGATIALESEYLEER